MARAVVAELRRLRFEGYFLIFLADGDVDCVGGRSVQRPHDPLDAVNGIQRIFQYCGIFRRHHVGPQKIRKHILLIAVQISRRFRRRIPRRVEDVGQQGILRPMFGIIVASEDESIAGTIRIRSAEICRPRIVPRGILLKLDEAVALPLGCQGGNAQIAAVIGDCGFHRLAHSLLQYFPQSLFAPGIALEQLPDVVLAVINPSVPLAVDSGILEFVAALDAGAAILPLAVQIVEILGLSYPDHRGMIAAYPAFKSAAIRLGQPRYEPARECVLFFR